MGPGDGQLPHEPDGTGLPYEEEKREASPSCGFHYICFTEKSPCRQPRAPVPAAPQILRMAGSHSYAGERSTSEGLGKNEAR